MVGKLAIILSLAVIVVFHSSSFTSLYASATFSSSAAGTNQLGAQTMMTYQESLVSLLSNDLETKINKSGTILEVTSRLSEFNSVPFANSISPELHGISKDQT
ncbi:MAG: hypothetical protein M3270_01645 [Thermoproteota archaeon]|nr:hypothetical protein [Thermoproteota archaeon]